MAKAAKSKSRSKSKSKLTKHDFKVARVFRKHFLDSGSFSLRLEVAKYAQTHGGDPHLYYDSPQHFQYLDEYAAFIRKYHDGCTLYANVDVIGDSERSYRNQLYLEDRGIMPVPVVHYMDSVDVLNRYLARPYKHLALGGLAAAGGHPHCQKWIDTMFDRICDTPDRTPCVKVHGFGVGSIPWIHRYPWWSVDSASWLHAAKYGSIFVPKTTRSKTPGDHHFEYEGWYFKFRFDVKFDVIAISYQGLDTSAENHYESLKQLNHFRGIRVTKWLEYIDLPMGETKFAADPKDNEIVVRGVTNTLDFRGIANMMYYEEMFKTLPPYPQPFHLKRRRTLGLF